MSFITSWLFSFPAKCGWCQMNIWGSPLWERMDKESIFIWVGASSKLGLFDIFFAWFRHLEDLDLFLNGAFKCVPSMLWKIYWSLPPFWCFSLKICKLNLNFKTLVENLLNSHLRRNMQGWIISASLHHDKGKMGKV